MISKLYRLALKVTNPVFVPLENRRLAGLSRGGGGRLEEEIANAIDRGFEYFFSLEALDLASLYIFKRILSPSQVPDMGLVDRRLAEYRAKWQNPNLRLLDPEYDPNSKDARRAQVWRAPHPLEALMVKCAYADREGLTEVFLDELEAIDDGGKFGTTHIIFGAVILKEFSDFPEERLDRLIEEACSKLVRAQATSRAGNLFYERVAFLLWQGWRRHVDEVWIRRILRAQRADGGWSTGRFWHAPTKQHPSCLALASLVLYRDTPGTKP
jgi:hypothetical protein